ncbi:four helix bundle protein [soil metagenome]|jgi:four helix bundle protein
MGDFRRLEAWQKSRELTADLNRLLPSGSLRSHPGMRAQILRAADSIPSNLAEGCAKNSRSELARFAETAYASAKELLSHLILCRDRGALSECDFDDLLARTDHVARLCFGLQRMGRKKA